MSQTRRKKKNNPPVENTMEEIQSDIEVEVVQRPSGTMEKLKLDLNQHKGEIRLLKEEIRLLKDENRLLSQERDLLKEKARFFEAGPTTSKGSQKRRRGDSSISLESDSDALGKKRKGKKRRRRPPSSSSSEDCSSDDRRPKKKPKSASFGKRVMSPEDVVHRYKKVLKTFKRTRSMTTTCEVLKVDRNTIAGTAVIADVLIAGEGGEFGELPVIDEKQSLANYAKLCKAFLDANQPLLDKVSQMRKATELLPIKYKMKK